MSGLDLVTLHNRMIELPRLALDWVAITSTSGGTVIQVEHNYHTFIDVATKQALNSPITCTVITAALKLVPMSSFDPVHV